MKNLMIVLGTLTSISAQAGICNVDGMKTLPASHSLKRGEIVGEVVLKNDIVARAGASEVTLVNEQDGSFTILRFREKLSQDVVLKQKSLLRMWAVSDHQDNQDKFLNCGENAGTCVHVDHPLVDTIAFSNEKVGVKQLNRAGVDVCIL